jgi:hypothetical protein
MPKQQVAAPVGVQSPRWFTFMRINRLRARSAPGCTNP